MSQFATELPVPESFDPTIFTDEIVAWLRGNRHSSVLEIATPDQLSGDDLQIRAPNGERLDLRLCREDGRWLAVGCRYDAPDDNGRLWRTEAVLRAGTDGFNLLRIRAQCLAIKTLARLEVPKRTHILRNLLEAGLAAPDGDFLPATTPHHLTEAQLDLAARIVAGGASRRLPILYLSRSDKGTLPIKGKALSQLALDLAGVAHVVCEPSRTFSFQLRDLVGDGNVYNGSIGIALPGRSFARRYHTWSGHWAPDALAEELRRTAIALRSEMPKRGSWEWLDLQEAILRAHRKAESSRLSAAESEQLWQDELQIKEDQIRDLQAEIEALREAAIDRADEAGQRGFDFDLPEIYPGEISDRLRAAADFCLDKGTDAGWDSRSLAVFDAFLAAVSPSSALEELRKDIKRATRDPKKCETALRKLLARHGFVFKSDNKHSRMEPGPDFAGLTNVTLMKTPSEIRGLDNLRHQIEGNLGITRLKQSAR